ncbi:hypothetical protein RvY_13702 [Ramazzottius varieornatus]|uniref:ER membrane protein complex subunit 4 n=1 Tax=Ramazzottius varieornatus TaxID=947166 RepID=A0A1D1VNT1_RAMVA|nr:hypothetical protein RvY_13702 [Ramazzottius varieornatus]
MPVSTTAKYSASMGKPSTKKTAGASEKIINSSVVVRPEKLFQVSYRPGVNRSDLPPPIGYNPNVVYSSESVTRSQDTTGLIEKRSWDIAMAPLKQVPMNFFVMWMSGNAISLFPIMMLVMMFWKPVQAIIGAQSTFKQISGKWAPIQKLVYLFGNVVALSVALYKCHSMGLLPTEPSDWLSFEKPLERTEFLAGGRI